MKKLEYEIALNRFDELLELNPKTYTKEFKELCELIDEIQVYEDKLLKTI